MKVESEHVGLFLAAVLPGSFYPLAAFLYGSMLLGIAACDHSRKSAEQAEGAVSSAQSPALCVSTAALAVTGIIDSLPQPVLRKGMGNSHLRITTNNPEAQRWFDYGINLLHDFWHIEAYRAFKEVIKADSACAMGYWGVAMCQPGFGGSDNSVWQRAIAKAKALQTQASPLEKALIGATDALVQGGIHQAVPAFWQLAQQYPGEPEAQASAAIVLRQNVRTDDGLKTSNEVKSLLERAMQRFPTPTGLQHYYVHVMEVRPDFKSVAGLAEQMPSSAPSASHITHMPGHIYFLQGQYAKAVAVFEKAHRQEVAYHQAENIPYVADQNYMHNLHYLAVAASELGDKEKALKAAEQYASITLRQQAAGLVADGSSLMLLYEGRILPALVHMRFREFALAEKRITYWLNSLDIPLTNRLVRLYLQGMQAYCRGMVAIERGDVAQATTQGGQLTQYMGAFEQEGIQHQQAADFKSETYDILSKTRYELAGWIDNIDTNRPFNDMAWKAALDLEGSIAYDEPPRLMYPIGESMGRLHLRRGELPKPARRLRWPWQNARQTIYLGINNRSELKI